MSSSLVAPLSDAEWHARCLTACVGSVPQGPRGVYFCPYPLMCKAGFLSLKRLHLHIHKEHPMCLLCAVSTSGTNTARYRSNEALTEHSEAKHKTCIFVDCKRRLPSMNALLQHYRDGHPLRCCVLCRTIPVPIFGDSWHTQIRDVLCKKCTPKVTIRAPALVEIPAGHDTYESIERQFRGNWLHRSQKPEVIKIWKIFGKKVYVDRYMAYKDKVIESSGYPDGNAKRRWHGTTRTCRLGDTSSHSQICNDLRCSLCRIIETSFDVVKSGKKTDWGRFGSGIYTSSTSSKADSYVHELGGSRYSTMLLNAVVLGRSKELTENSPDLKQPPAGYQSVTGVPGHDLNYDECIVYDNDAIRPMYLVVYQD